MGSDGEGEAHVHSAGIVLDGRIKEFLELAEVDDLVELPNDLGLRHPKDGDVEEDVLAAAQIGVKTGADFQERSDAAVDVRPPAGRLRDAGENLQQGALPGAVPADQPDHFS